MSKARAAVRDPDMSLGSKLGNKIADAAKKKAATLHVYELLQIHEDGRIIVAYKIHVVYMDAEKIVNAVTADRKRMPGCCKKRLAYRIGKAKDLNALAAEKMLEKIPAKVHGKFDENGVVGHVAAFPTADGIKKHCIEQLKLKEEKVVLADPGILYEGIGEDIGSPIRAGKSPKVDTDKPDFAMDKKQ